MQELITIREFATIAGVTEEAVYKRLRKQDNPLKEFVQVVGNRKMIDKSALDIFYKGQYNHTTTQPSSKVVQPTPQEQTEDAEQQKKDKEAERKTASQQVIDILKEQLEAQRKDIESKNFIIAELNERLAESQTMLDQQQKLSMADKKRILELEASAEEKQEMQEQKKRKGFFNFFKRL